VQKKQQKTRTQVERASVGPVAMFSRVLKQDGYGGNSDDF